MDEAAPTAMEAGGKGGPAVGIGTGKLRPHTDRHDRLARRVARAQARIAREVADASMEQIEAVPEALSTLRGLVAGAKSERDRRLAATDILNHYRAVGKMGEGGGTVNIDARTQQVIADPETLRALLGREAQKRLADGLDAEDAS